MSVTTNRWTGKPYRPYYFELLNKRMTLPVWQQKDEFLQALENNQILILAGHTGSGKTTQIPQIALEFGLIQEQARHRMIACTQPHGAAAICVAHQVAHEMDVSLGEEVGYSILFDDCYGPKTILKFLTESMLLREACVDHLLERYWIIIVDGADERTSATDVLLVVLKKILEERSDLKLLVMCVPSMGRKFKDYFQDAAQMTVRKQLHAVELFYAAVPQESYLVAAISIAVHIHRSQPSGNLLVFLSGEREIEDACVHITNVIGKMGDQVGPVKVIPLHSALPLSMQQKIYEPAPAQLMEDGAPGRKIVVSTNIAVTSFTMDDIVYVIDSGLVEVKYCGPHYAEVFLDCPISKANARKRLNLAGSSRPGKCYRLYSQSSFERVLHETHELISWSKFASFVLIMLKLGIRNVAHCDYLDPPPVATMSKAAVLLYFMGAIDSDANLTKLGEIMGEFPLDPELSRMLILSPDFNCSNEILTIVAMLSVPQATEKAKAKFIHTKGDHLTLLNIYNAYKENNEDSLWCRENFINESALRSAVIIREQLAHLMARFNLKLCSTDINSHDGYIRKAILAGSFMHVAYLNQHGQYVRVQDNKVLYLHPSSCLDHKTEWVLFNDYVWTDDIFFIRTVTPIQGDWLIDISPTFYDLDKPWPGEVRHALEPIHNERWKERALKLAILYSSYVGNSN